MAIEACRQLKEQAWHFAIAFSALARGNDACAPHRTISNWKMWWRCRKKHKPSHEVRRCSTTRMSSSCHRLQVRMVIWKVFRWRQPTMAVGIPVVFQLCIAEYQNWLGRSVQLAGA